MITGDLHISPLLESDIGALAAVLLEDSVYEHIGGTPSADDFLLGLQRALQGPPASRRNEQWLHFAVRLLPTEQIIGRLEATVHDGIAEVAFLFDPQSWGRGYATQALQWLHGHLNQTVSAFWATTVPANRSSARLLERCGYRQIAPAHAPVLYSYDEGDLVFVRPNPD
jgi:RimJ/RimL family protein N-acetyltransferase